MRVIYRKIRHAHYLYIKRNVEKVWGARYTLGARYLAKNTVYSLWYHHTYRWPSHAQIERGLSQSVHGTANYRCDDTRDCIIQFAKLIIKFSSSSWLILINKYIEMHGQQNIKILICVFI